MTILIQNGHVIDPLTGRDEVCDVLVRDGKIQKIGTALSEEAEAGSGRFRVLCHAGTDRSPCTFPGSGAGVQGNPGNRRKGGCPWRRHYCLCHAQYQAGDRHGGKGGGCTRQSKEGRPGPCDPDRRRDQRAGKEKSWADIAGMAREGCHAISEDGKSVMNASPVPEGHAGGKSKRSGRICPLRGHYHGGRWRDERGRKRSAPGTEGNHQFVEDVIVARDILLAKETGVRLHLCHCSTADSVEMIRLAKEEGLPVTGEVCPHHFTLSADDIRENDGNYKMNPPASKQSGCGGAEKRSQRRRYGRDFHRSCALTARKKRISPWRRLPLASWDWRLPQRLPIRNW